MIEKIKSRLNLLPHVEGGFFKETYRSADNIPGKILPDRYGGDRCYGTAIYYMITRKSFSSMHRIQSDEIFHFYLGDPLVMLQLFPDGTGKTVELGNDILNGIEPQVVVPAGVWQGMRLKEGGDFALMGTTVAPGFEYIDFEHGDREKLLNDYPEFNELIVALTEAK